MFRTSAAYFSGAVCGHMWMPDAMAGKPMHKSIRGIWGFMPEGEGYTFRDALLRLVRSEGGDFQNAQFSADSEIVIERRENLGPGKYRVHIRRVEVAKLAPDLVNPEAYTGDFFDGEC